MSSGRQRRTTRCRRHSNKFLLSGEKRKKRRVNSKFKKTTKNPNGNSDENRNEKMSCFSKIGEKELMRKGEKGESERSSEREDKRQGSCWPTLRQPTTRSQGACSRGYSGTGMLRAPLSPSRPFFFSLFFPCVCVCVWTGISPSSSPREKKKKKNQPDTNFQPRREREEE